MGSGSRVVRVLAGTSAALNIGAAMVGCGHDHSHVWIERGYAHGCASIGSLGVAVTMSVRGHSTAGLAISVG